MTGARIEGAEKEKAMGGLYSGEGRGLGNIGSAAVATSASKSSRDLEKKGRSSEDGATERETFFLPDV
jgi:hypothetical protein